MISVKSMSNEVAKGTGRRARQEEEEVRAE